MNSRSTKPVYECRNDSSSKNVQRNNTTTTPSGSPAKSSSILNLQKSIGNRGVQRIVRVPRESSGGTAIGIEAEGVSTMEEKSVAQVLENRGQRQITGTPKLIRDENPAIQRQSDTEEASTSNEAGLEEPSVDDVCVDYEADAQLHFQSNMLASLRNAAAIEGAAIGRRASHQIGDRVRETCEPFERDQEIDTQILNNVFAITGGAANLTRGLPGGASSGSTRGINIASRVVNIGLNVLATNMRSLAGYHTVGELKDAAVRQLGREAEQAGETGAGSYGQYENDVLDQLEEDWQQEIDSVMRHIRAARSYSEAQFMSSMARRFWSLKAAEYQTKLRVDYGSRSSHAESMISQINGILNPRLTRLQEHLQEAKEKRELWQGLAAIGGGIAGGAALGAAIGAPFAGVGAVPGAIIGGIVGGVVGTVGAVAIWWD